ncbi:hypothetical protein D3C75_301470 [compost metagenome]
MIQLNTEQRPCSAADVSSGTVILHRHAQYSRGCIVCSCADKLAVRQIILLLQVIPEAAKHFTGLSKRSKLFSLKMKQ